MALAEKLALDQVTYVPSSSEREQLPVVHDFITEHERAGKGSIAPRYFLAEMRRGSMSNCRRTLRRSAPYLASVRIPLKKSANASCPCSGSTCETYWSGRTTTMQPVSRFTPRRSKMSSAFGSGQNIFS
jgi:hypothetical protein